MSPSFSSQSDWENVWHQETHSRCRDKLVRQLYWACEKDIYRLTRRNKKRTGNDEAWIKKTTTERKLNRNPFQPKTIGISNDVQLCYRSIDFDMIPPAVFPADGSTWLHVNYANMFLRSRRSDGNTPSISNECCTKAGCTWEEYAEYCPSNKRRNHY